MLNKNGYSRIVLPIDSNTKGKNKIVYTAEIAKRFNSEVSIFEAHSTDTDVEHSPKNN